jgi:glucose-6-phosphate 1-dehydrogenase
MELNRLLASVTSEDEIFRVDHFLAMTTVQTLLGTRLANRVLEPIWNSAHIEEIEIIWEESLALEGRAAYYDGVGALKDMVQNHLLQILCLVAMEPPISLGERDLRDRKVDVLRSIRPFDAARVRSATRRACYGAGWLSDHDVPAYVEEEGVDPAHGTETFAEVVLGLDSWRWADTTFRLRTGKALRSDRKEVVVHFRPVPHLPSEDAVPPSNLLRFGLEPQDLALELTGVGPGVGFSLVPLVLQADLEEPELPAYGRLLLNVLSGDTTLSIRGDEAEESWRVVTRSLRGGQRAMCRWRSTPPALMDRVDGRRPVGPAHASLRNPQIVRRCCSTRLHSACRSAGEDDQRFHHVLELLVGDLERPFHLIEVERMGRHEGRVDPLGLENT